MKRKRRNIPIIIPNQDFYTSAGWFSSKRDKQDEEARKNEKNMRKLALKNKAK